MNISTADAHGLAIAISYGMALYGYEATSVVAFDPSDNSFFFEIRARDDFNFPGNPTYTIKVSPHD